MGFGIYFRGAFTLAEVLITLGIIGVVAAMTLPSLIAKYQMKSFEVAFKKQYSVIQNTVNYFQLEENLNECYAYLYCAPEGSCGYQSHNSDCDALKNGLISKLKLTEIKNDFTYKSASDVYKEGGVATNYSVAFDAYIKESKSFLAPDGTVVFLDYLHKNMGAAMISFDVNGKKGPNKWGYDLFFMQLDADHSSKKLRLYDSYGGLAEKGGKLPRTILRQDENNSTK